VPPEAETVRLAGVPEHIDLFVGPVIVGVGLTVTVAAELEVEHPLLFETMQ
jgi:hypothetical protein